MLSADIFSSQKERLGLSAIQGLDNFRVVWDRFQKMLGGPISGDESRLDIPVQGITSTAREQINFFEGEIRKIRGVLAQAILENDRDSIKNSDQKLSGLRHLQVITFDFASGISGALENFDTGGQPQNPISHPELKAVIGSPRGELLLQKYFYFQNGILGIGLSEDRKGQLQSLYRNNWEKEHSQEWVAFLQGKLDDSFDDQNRFYIASINPNGSAIILGQDDSKVLGYLRIGPYEGTNESGQTPLYAKYLGAVNIDAQYQGVGFSRFIVGAAFDDVLISEGAEVYLHVIPGSNAHTFWQSLGFADIRVEDCFYGDDKMKNQPSQLMKITYSIWNSKKQELTKK